MATKSSGNDEAVDSAAIESVLFRNCNERQSR